MAQWDSADLLAKCRQYARRPVNDQSMPNEAWYSFLTDAEAEVYPDLFTRYPEMAYSAPVRLTSSDSGLTYGFGTDAANDAVRPMGHAEIYPDARAIPDSPLSAGVDFMVEGSVIRFLGGLPRNFSSGPYARFVSRPDQPIRATVQPSLEPKNARMLLVWKALEAWASRPGSGADPNYYEARYDKALSKMLLELATEYNRVGENGGNERWWTTGDLLRAGVSNF